MTNNVTNVDQLAGTPLSPPPELTPRALVIDLLAVSDMPTLPTPALSLGGELMGFTAGAIRVAISRLASDGLIESPDRGEWSLVRSAPWMREQARWQRLDALTNPWNGHWWLVICNQVPRSRRSIWRAHEHALVHRGFREADRDIFLRPANLKLSFQELWSDLTQLGMQTSSHIAEAAAITLRPAPSLWQYAQRTQALTDVFIDMQALLQKRHASTEQACREFLLLGRRAARLLNNDPLLPEEWAGPSPRQDVATLMPTFVDAGRAFWLQFLGFRQA